jgi:hypothetical protein
MSEIGMFGMTGIGSAVLSIKTKGRRVHSISRNLRASKTTGTSVGDSERIGDGTRSRRAARYRPLVLDAVPGGRPVSGSRETRRAFEYRRIAEAWALDGRKDEAIAALKEGYSLARKSGFKRYEQEILNTASRLGLDSVASWREICRASRNPGSRRNGVAAV